MAIRAYFIENCLNRLPHSIPCFRNGRNWGHYCWLEPVQGHATPCNMPSPSISAKSLPSMAATRSSFSTPSHYSSQNLQPIAIFNTAPRLWNDLPPEFLRFSALPSSLSLTLHHPPQTPINQSIWRPGSDLLDLTRPSWISKCPYAWLSSGAL